MADEKESARNVCVAVFPSKWSELAGALVI
jgi:hypothetical protein